MTQGCLKCLKYTMCVANFLCFVCGAAVVALGIYLMVNFNKMTLMTTLATFSIANVLLISGIVMTCISFLGFMGALRENRCLLLTFFLLLFILMLVELTTACLLLHYESDIHHSVENDLNQSLQKAKTHPNNSTMSNEWDLVQRMFKCCGVNNASDWGDQMPLSCYPEMSKTNNTRNFKEGCLKGLKNWYEENFLSAGIAVIVLCIIEVLGMCFAMTLFCHISRSGLGYKL